MKKIFLGFIILLSSLQALEVNEYLSDVYFANGINTDEDSARDSVDDISEKFPSLPRCIAEHKGLSLKLARDKALFCAHF